MCAFLNKLDDKVLSGGVEKSSWGHHLLQTQILSPFLPPGSYACQRKGRAVSIGLGALAPERVLFIYQRTQWARPRLPGAAAPTLPRGLSPSTKRIPTPQCSHLGPLEVRRVPRTSEELCWPRHGPRQQGTHSSDRPL